MSVVYGKTSESNPGTVVSLTGGTAFFPGTMKELDAMYERISGEVRAQYTIGYVSSNLTKNGAWRKVSLRITRPGARSAPVW